MERSWWWKTAFFAVITAVSLLYLVPTVVPEAKQPPFLRKHLTKKLQLGLDLQGGMRLLYEEAVSEAVSDKAERDATDLDDTLRDDKFGVSEPSIVRKGSDIVIELPDLKEADFERIQNIIGRTAQLEFKIVDDSEATNAYMKALAPLIPKDAGIDLRTPVWQEKD